MRDLIILGIFCVLLALASCKDDKRYHDQKASKATSTESEAIAEILQFQEEMNAGLRDPETSPLPDKHRKDFTELNFFKPDTIYRVWARLVRTPQSQPFLMPTTTSRKSKERVYGVAHFRIGESDFQLEIYQNLEILEGEEYDDYLFLPFTDNTNGELTYAGGRYIDLEIPAADSILIDFNRAYNPYCVYNKKYSCPIVPKVNHLDAEIRAGVKDFK